MVCFALFGLPWSLTGSCPSVAIVFEIIAPLPFVLGATQLALLKCLTDPFFTCPVRISSHPFQPVSLAAKGLLGCGVSGVFCFVWVLLFGLFVPLFSVFCFLIPFASLHALALSLTSAQRTDSSSASKKKACARQPTAGEQLVSRVFLCGKGPTV